MWSETTKKELDNIRLEYSYVDLSLDENSKELKMIKNLGFRSVPVIMEDEEPVSLGYLLS